eukprot:scaffold3319_cov258-Pinguiococcus_pyrenoidosus.AAC.12
MAVVVLFVESNATLTHRSKHEKAIWAISVLSTIPNNVQRIQHELVLVQVLYDLLLKDRKGKQDEDETEERVKVLDNIFVPLNLKRNLDQEVIVAKGAHRRRKKTTVEQRPPVGGRKNPGAKSRRPWKDKTPFGRAGENDKEGTKGLIDNEVGEDDQKV